MTVLDMNVATLPDIVGQVEVRIVEFIIVGSRARQRNAEEQEHGDRPDKHQPYVPFVENFLMITTSITNSRLGYAPVIFVLRCIGETGGDGSAPLLSTVLPVSVSVAAGWRCGIVRVRAERAQTGLGVRNTEHGKRSGLMLAVEWRGLGRVDVASGQSRRILGIVEPETQMESVRRVQAHVGVKTEDIVQKNRLDLDMAVIRLFANLDIGLVPSQTEAPSEIGVLGSIGLKEAVLDREQIKHETRLDPVEIQN